MKPDTELSTERKLLLALIGRENGVLDRGTVPTLFHQIRWSKFLAGISRDLYPYLAFQLERYANIGDIEAPPEWELLRRARRMAGIQNLRLRHELRRTIEGLNERSIPALALKGIVLAYTAYPDPSLRPMSDVDLLVPLEKREKALLVLSELGFDQHPDWAIATQWDHGWCLDSNQEYGPLLRLRGSSVLLEVHSQLECGEPLFPVPVEEFWSRSVAVDIMGLKARSLCPEDFLFHVCLHQSRSHRFEKGLLPLIDLRFLLASHTDWDWLGIAERSVRCGCAAWMHLTLGAARDFAGAPVPDIFFEALPRPPDPWNLRCLVEEQIWAARTGLFIAPEGLQRFLAERSWRGRARILLTRLRLVACGPVERKLTLSGLMRRARLLLARVCATLRTPAIRRYFRAWKNGQLTEAIRRTTEGLRKAKRLYGLVAEQEARWAGGKDQLRHASRSHAKDDHRWSA